MHRSNSGWKGLVSQMFGGSCLWMSLDRWSHQPSFRSTTCLEPCICLSICISLSVYQPVYFSIYAYLSLYHFLVSSFNSDLWSSWLWLRLGDPWSRVCKPSMTHLPKKHPILVDTFTSKTPIIFGWDVNTLVANLRYTWNMEIEPQKTWSISISQSSGQLI